MNTEEFIERAKLKHGEKYDYSKVEHLSEIFPKLKWYKVNKQLP